MKKLLENFLNTYKLQKQHLDKNNNYTMDGKNFIDWYIKESGNVVNNINYTRCCESDSELLKWDSTQPSFGDWLKLIGAEKMTTGDFAYRQTIVSRQWIINLYEAMYNPF